MFVPADCSAGQNRKWRLFFSKGSEYAHHHASCQGSDRSGSLWRSGAEVSGAGFDRAECVDCTPEFGKCRNRNSGYLCIGWSGFVGSSKSSSVSGDQCAGRALDREFYDSNQRVVRSVKQHDGNADRWCGSLYSDSGAVYRVSSAQPFSVSISAEGNCLLKRNQSGHGNAGEKE